MNFATAAKGEAMLTRTENGAIALNTTGSKLLDLFATIGSIREADTTRIERLFADAYAEDKLAATKIVFYARDIRGGLGERHVFRVLLRYMAQYHPCTLRNNIRLIPEFGRFDDWYVLIGTPFENDMWKAMGEQLRNDLKAMECDKPVSLLAKWIKTPDASSRNTRQLGITTALKLGYNVYHFKRVLRKLRKYIDVVEAKMSTNQWNAIEYSGVPSRAMMIYKDAFARHDEKRFNEFIHSALDGKAKINSSTLYPYDIMEKILYDANIKSTKDLAPLEAQWRQLPNYANGEHNVIVMADTSGSMWGRPLATAVGLAVYFAERNIGTYHNLWMSFSSDANFHQLKGETLFQKVKSMSRADWNMNTNLYAAFEQILDVAIKNNVPSDEMPEAIVVVSDMEIDQCDDTDDWTFYEIMAQKFARNRYTLPDIIFWNVASRHDVFHADSSRKGVQLVSGQSASTFEHVMKCIGMTPEQAMYETINSDRYSCITIAKED